MDLCRRRFSRMSDAIGLENALLDVIPEEALEMNKKRRMLRWDAKKRKFVKVTVCAWYSWSQSPC